MTGDLMPGTMQPETTSPVNRAIDFAAQQGSWWPVLAGTLVGVAVPLLIQGYWIAWVLLAAGLAMTVLRPAGISVRRRLLIRSARRAVAARRTP
jgi:hypothetical protein